MTKVKVLYVAGWGRSGSTLVGRLLGQVTGFFDVGEIQGLWRALFEPDWRCGCGETLQRCPFWMRALQDASINVATDPQSMMELRHRSVRTRHMPGLWLGQQLGRRPVPAYGDVLRRIYRAVAALSDAEVVVDTSKYPADAYIAAAVPDLDLFVLHLVRDPRAVAYSWSREKPHASGASSKIMRQISPARSSLMWTAINTSILAFLRGTVGPERYTRVRYEDFVSEPERQLARIVEQLGRPTTPFPFINGNEATISASHSVSGNPWRFTQDATRTITLDDEWRLAMHRRNRLLSLAPALPLMAPMGYPLRPR